MDLAPDESYIIYESDRSGEFGTVDLYITFKKKDNTWTDPKNMGKTVNSSWIDDQPSVTPDGKYLLFCRREAWVTTKATNIYWISSSIIYDLKSSNFTPYIKNTIPNKADTVGAIFHYQIPNHIFFDDDGNETLTLSANNLPGSLYFNSKTKTISGKMINPGKFTIEIVATDPSGESVSCLFNLTVIGKSSI